MDLPRASPPASHAPWQLRNLHCNALYHNAHNPQILARSHHPDSPLVKAGRMWEDQNCIETDVIFIGQTGVGKSSLVNMIMDAPVTKTSNDTSPATRQSTPYRISLDGGLRCLLWDTRGLPVDEMPGAQSLSNATLMGSILGQVFQPSSVSELKEILRDRIRLATPIIVWCVNATRIDVDTPWQQFHKVYVEYCNRMAIPVVVITHGPPKRAGWEARCSEQIRRLDLGVDVPVRMVRRYRSSSSPEYSQDSEVLKVLISELMRGEYNLTSSRREVDTQSPISGASSINNATPPQKVVASVHMKSTMLPLSNDLTGQITRDGHDPVASGAFADIYRGTLQGYGGVAIKAIKTYSSEDCNFTKKHKRLRREIKVWLNLRHDNVLLLLGTTAGFGRYSAMVCPWAENGTLTSYLEEHYDGLSAADILGLLNDVASGLQYLHSCSIVHGDLSGSNILICGNQRACIADFGLSMLLTELGASTFATSFHARGTLRWTAPELLDLEIREDGTEDEPTRVVPTTQCDVYSFGSIMLQILSGKIPYHYYMREGQVMRAISQGMTPKRPVVALVTERRWMFLELCWASANEERSRPSSGEIVAFTGEELAGVM